MEVASVEIKTVKRETLKAILVVTDEGDEAWVPRSVIDEESEVFDVESGEGGGTLIVFEWFAVKQGWT